MDHPVRVIFFCWTLVNEKEFRMTTGFVLFVQTILANIKSDLYLHNLKSLFTFC